MDDHPLAYLGSWRVVLLILAVIGVILFLSFLLTTFTGQGERGQTTQNSVASLPSITPNIIPTTSQTYDKANTSGGAEIYQTKIFSIAYPTSWNVSASSSAGSIITTFGEDTESDISPQLAVSTLDKKGASYSLLSGANLYNSSDYTKANMSIDGVPAVKYSGIFPPTYYRTQNPNSFLMWESDIYFAKGNIEYVIRYTYPGNHEDPAYEKLFSIMLSSIKLP